MEFFLFFVVLSIDSVLLLVHAIKNLAEVIDLLVDAINCVFEFFGINYIITWRFNILYDINGHS